MLVGDFKIFLIELIAIIIISVIAYHVFDCVAGFVLTVLFAVLTIIAAVFFSVWIAMVCVEDTPSYVFWVAAPMVFYALLSLLAYEYPLEIAGIRLVLGLFGAYFVDYYSDVYGTTMVLAVEYAVFAMFLLGTIASFMDDC